MTNPAWAYMSVLPSKYQTALQHPERAFDDPRLSRSRVELRDGMPKYRSGGYALVYRLTSRDNVDHREEATALRCFREPQPDLVARYAQISSHLARHAARSPYFVSTRLLENGIRIEGLMRPVTTMAWIEGEYLDLFLDRASRSPEAMAWLANRIRGLAEELRRAGMAHGDLHYKNILITTLASGEHLMRLVDYDGMFVPALAGMEASEPGHEDYQHPLRTERSFGPALDSFSLMVLYLNIVAVQRHPELWDARSRVEGLLTREIDYLNPDDSQTLARLGGYRDLQRAVNAFKRACVGDYGDIPAPRDFFALFDDETPPLTTAPAHRASDARPAPEATATPTSTTLPSMGRPRSRIERPPKSKAIGTQRVQLVAREGLEVAVVGRLRRIVDGEGTPMSPLQTLYLESRGATFEVMIDREVADRSHEFDRDWSPAAGDWIWVQGLLLRDGDRFAIDLEQPANIAKVIQVDETHFTFYPELAAEYEKQKAAEAFRGRYAVPPELTGSSPSITKVATGGSRSWPAGPTRGNTLAGRAARPAKPTNQEASQQPATVEDQRSSTGLGKADASRALRDALGIRKREN